MVLIAEGKLPNRRVCHNGTNGLPESTLIATVVDASIDRVPSGR